MFVHVPRHVQSYFIWGGSEAHAVSGEYSYQPYRTDCGWSAPVVGLYRQAEGFLKRKKPTGNCVVLRYMYKLQNL